MHYAPIATIYEKVWSNSFICTEVLEDLEANKQYSTPVWRQCRNGMVHQTRR